MIVSPLASPVPPSPETSKALLAAFAERNIAFVPSSRVLSVDSARKLVLLDGDRELPCDQVLAVPRNRASIVDVDFSGGPKPSGTFHEPSELMRGDKQDFGAQRRARWFGRASSWSGNSRFARCIDQTNRGHALLSRRNLVVAL